MSSSEDTGNVIDPTADVNVKRPATSTPRIDSSNHSSLPPDTASGEAERLLDIDGLLEMARLIRIVRDDGRLGWVDKRN